MLITIALAQVPHGGRVVPAPFPSLFLPTFDSGAMRNTGRLVVCLRALVYPAYRLSRHACCVAGKTEPFVEGGAIVGIFVGDELLSGGKITYAPEKQADMIVPYTVNWSAGTFAGQPCHR